MLFEIYLQLTPSPATDTYAKRHLSQLLTFNQLVVFKMALVLCEIHPH